MSPLCSTSTLNLSKHKPGNKAPEKKFYWPDNIKVGPKQAPARQPATNVGQATVDLKGAPGKVSMKLGDPIDVDELTAQQLCMEETNVMVAEITAISIPPRPD